MGKYIIGGFATYEITEDGEPRFHYDNDQVEVLNAEQTRIILVIINNSIKYHNFICAREIEQQLKTGSIYSIQKIISRLRDKDAYWREAIETSKKGYRVKYQDVSTTYDEKNTKANTNVNDTAIDDHVNVEKQKEVSQTRTYYRSSAYISNFIANNKRVRTYYYSTTLKNVIDIMYPVTLINSDDYSEVELSINRLYESKERYRYVISGQVGSSKSLLARKLALEAANEYSNIGALPVLYDLKKFSETDKSLFDLLKEEYESYIPEGEPSYAENLLKSLVPDSEFYYTCQRGSLLLIFDNYDDLSPSLKDSFLMKLKHFLRSYGNNNVLLFTRPIGSFAELNDFNVLSIRQLRNDAISGYIDLYIDPTDEEKKFVKDSVFRRNAVSLFPSPLYSNPLFLAIIASMYKKYFFFCEPSISEAMERFIMYITCEDKLNKPRYSKSGLTPTEFKRIMCSFCAFLVDNNIESFDIADIERYRQVSPENNFDEEDFCDDLCRMYGLTCFVDGKYRFIDGLIVEYFYTLNLVNYDRNLISFWRFEANCYIYSVESVLDLLLKMDKELLFTYIYVPFNNEYCSHCSEHEYKHFLVTFYPQLNYYVGEGEYKVNNTRTHKLYKHFIRDLNVEQNIENLVFPPFESLKKCAVYNINKEEAETLGIEEGMYNAFSLNSDIINAMGLTPVGYIYELNMSYALNGTDEISEALRNVLLLNDFPLRKEFNQAFICCSNIENGDVVY